MSDTVAMILLLAIAIPLFGLLLVGAVLVVRDTIRQKGKWGINTRLPVCRKCGEPVPAVRMPANRRQALWGGWTCKECGFELDKWGEPIEDQPRTGKWAAMDALEAAEAEEARPPQQEQVKARDPKPRPADERIEGEHHE